MSSVAIIGGGAAGLVTAKSMVEQGFKPTVFEKYDQIGGVWRNNNGNSWSTMHTNVSKYMVSFSDFTWPEATQLFPTAEEVADYLRSYVKHFNLKDYIKCNCSVIYVTQLNDNRWLVKWTDTIKNEKNEEIFDYLVVSSGFNSNPNLPLLKNSKLFKGIQLHSMNYNTLKLNENLNGKRVIVVGHSFSGTDIGADLVSECNADVLNLINKAHWILNTTIIVDDNSKHAVPFDFALINRKLVTFMMENFKNQTDKSVFKNELFARNCKEQECIKELYIDEKSSQPALFSISPDYLKYVKSGKIRVKRGKIKSFNENGIILEDGTFESADIVIYATGYLLKLDFLDKNILKKLEHDENDGYQGVIMYKNIIHPDIEHFAGVGLLMESSWPTLELQARYASLFFSGKIKKPSNEEFITALDIERAIRNRPIELREQFARPDWVTYPDELAKDIGALPNFEILMKTDPELYKILWEGPVVGAHYRLNDDNKEKYLNLFSQIKKEML